MTLPESETIDPRINHPLKGEEKTHNTDSHNTIKLEKKRQ